MKKYKNLKKELLRDKRIKKEYALLEPEFAVVRQIIDLRLTKNVSQKKLAEKIGTKQSAISRLERGFVNPSVSFLSRVASALGKKLVVEIR